MAKQKKKSTISFQALTVEGALIAPAMLAKIALREAGNHAEADYAVPKGLTIRDEIARYFRIGQAQFAGLTSAATPSAGATVRFTEDLLRDVFGFTDLQRIGQRNHEGRDYAVTLEGLGGRVPAVVVPPTDDLDRASDHLPGDGRRRSAASAIQDWLNANDAALWGIACNGERLRLVRDNASLTRPAYIEADLRQIFEAEGFADFATLWLLLHASRFGNPGSPPADCALELWRDAGTKEGIAARDRLRDGVEAALLALGNGFLSANPDLRERVQKGQLPMPEYFGQLLRLIYRLIFFLVAEERGLLHAPSAPAMARKLYAEGYALISLRERAIRRAAWDRHHDRWEGLLVTFTALHGGEPRLGLPALGGLFLPELMPDLLAAKLPNRALMEAVFRLAWLKDDSALVPVNWRDMETEELGSVYESLLELTPRLTDNGRGFMFAEGAETKGNARKTSGSYYTPDSLVQTLLDSALDPVLDQKEAQADDVAAALLTTTVIDPACGSGHFLLAAARRIASRLARARAGGVASAEDYRHALRDVARNCIYGVDRNPMAVELTKVALWIETVEPGKPLGFLDANIRCGDSLLGVFDLGVLAQGIPDEAYKPLTGDDKETAKYFSTRNKIEKRGQGSFDFAGGGGKLPAPPPLAPDAISIRALPEDSAEQIAEKKKRFASGERTPARWAWRTACDLYMAAFLLPKKGGAPANANTVTVPTSAHVWQAISGPSLHGLLVAVGQGAAMEASAFHWPLEFPDVMAAGGFDCVLGNPPWERIKLQEQEFFASREPEIANAPNAAARRKLIAKLKTAEVESREHKLFEDFEIAGRTAEASSVFARVPSDDGGRFPLAGRGDINTYAVFAELFLNLSRPNGRSGLLAPTGLATNKTTSNFFGAVVSSRRLVTLYAFDEIKNWFAGTKDNQSFCMFVTAARCEKPKFAFQISNTSELLDERRVFELTPTSILLFNPNTKTTPVFRSVADAELTAKIYSRVPVLIDDTKGKEGNPWDLTFSAMFHMSNDSGMFRTGAQLSDEGFTREGTDWGRDETEYVPLYEAKMVHHFDHRFGYYPEGNVDDTRALPRPTLSDKNNPSYEVSPRYWVNSKEVVARLIDKNWQFGWLMGWREITNSTNERTVINSISKLGSGLID